MKTLEKALLKKTPCDECRTRKRRCSSDKPCKRCISRGVNCSYTLITPPADLEYLQHLDNLEQVKSLETQICAMENELNALKLAQDKNNLKKSNTEMNLQYPSPKSVSTTGHPSPALSWHSFEHDSIYSTKPSLKKQKQLVAESGDLKVHIAPRNQEKNNFILSVNKGEITINTFIKSHQELLNTLFDILYTVKSDQNVPMPFTQISPDFHITSALTSLLWKSYIKQWIKGITKAMPLKRELNCLGVTKSVYPTGKMVLATLQLIHAYIGCLHLNQFYIHIPYFMTHFIEPDQPSQTILQSPAVMALCSTICLQTCQHVSAIIPPEASYSYALYYFEQARELVSEKFDEFSLEIMMTYAFMAFYKLKLRRNQESLRYIEMADRICLTLEQLYDNYQDSEDVVFFHRMKRFIRYVYHTSSMYEMVRRGGLNKYGGPRNFSDLLKESDILPAMLSDQDTLEEKEFIQLIQLKAQLQQSLHNIINNNPSSATLTTCVGEFSHQMEMAMRYWYRSILPERFQLSIALFEDNLSDFDYFMTLEKECGYGKVSPKLLCLIFLYNEYLVMGKAYVPKNPNELQPTSSTIVNYLKVTEAEIKRNKHSASTPAPMRWEKMLLRVSHYKKNHQQDDYEGDEADYIEQFINSIHPEEWNFDMPVARVSVIVAIHLVRLIQYLVTKDHVCFLDYKWLMNAWDMLLRASRFKYSLPEQGITLERIRANIILCMNIIQERAIYEKLESADLMIKKLEREFQDSVQESFTDILETE